MKKKYAYVTFFVFMLISSYNNAQKTTSNKSQQHTKRSQILQKKNKISTDTKDAKKTYHCSQCSKQLTTASNLARHRRSHTEEKQFFCSHCNKGFSRLHNCQRHENNLLCQIPKKKSRKRIVQLSPNSLSSTQPTINEDHLMQCLTHTSTVNSFASSNKFRQNMSQWIAEMS